MPVKSLKIPVINKEGIIEGEEKLSLPPLEEGSSLSLVGQAVRVYLSNQRRARAKTKTRSVVEGSKAKIWKQKGTGRARHGDRQAPIFVGGGVPHGPTGTQNYKLKLNKKTLRKAILSIFLTKLSEKKLFLVKGTKLNKTKDAYLFYEKIKENLKTDKAISLLTSKDDENKRYLRNLAGVQLLSINSLNPYLLLKNDFLLLSEPGMAGIESYFELKEKKNAD